MELFITAVLLIMQLELIGFFVWRKFNTNRAKRPTFIDTSVLMDGRIITIVKSGFIPNRIYIPASVLRELQLLADGSDSDKRVRARHGLDIASELTNMKSLTRVINDTANDGVDESLLSLATKYKGSICTIDFNLNKVAQAKNIPVLNVHELAQQLRSNYLPGERVSIAIIQKGSDPKQGVGYMADGTMVVVDKASANINQTVAIEIIRSIQTAAGRMLFAKKIEQSSKANRDNGDNSKRPKKRGSAEDMLISLVDKQD
jgi:uncharacterized protein YacL